MGMGLQATAGFVRINFDGVSLADRIYEIEIDPLANTAGPSAHRRIRLIGMIHIGEEEGYRTLFRDLGNPSRLTIVLSEGVSDTEGLLKSGFSFEAIADFLGVEEQRSIEDYIEREFQDDTAQRTSATFVNADLDLTDFDPATIDWLEQIGTLYSGSSGLSHLFAINLDLVAQPEKAATITEDIIIRRNRNLISWIKASRINYQEIVVPWGALHLPGIEAAILQMGFDLREHTYVPLISWTKVGHSLFGEGE